MYGNILHLPSTLLGPNFWQYHALVDSAVMPKLIVSKKSAMTTDLFNGCPAGAATIAMEKYIRHSLV
jgi:hypothetical protein